MIEEAEPDEELRFWVTACSTGEEAYSLAILINEALRDANKHLRIKIFATDIDRVALEKASLGIYPQSIANDVPVEWLHRYFIAKDNGYQVMRKLREMMIFSPHDLTKDAGFTRMHLISCRNVLIYMQPSLQHQVLRNLHFSLIAKGVLFLGEAESVAVFESEFKALDKKWKIYQKRRNIRLPMSLKANPRVPTSSLLKSSISPQQKFQSESIREQSLKRILKESKSLMLMVSPEHRLLHICGDGSKIIKAPDGDVGNEITKMVVPSLQLPLNIALHRVKKENKSVLYTDIKLKDGDEFYSINLKVIPPDADRETGNFNLVKIDYVSVAPPKEKFQPKQFEIDNETQVRFLDLEQELQETRENLQALVEELETTNEEQQATNEELTASNEELQSTNEELHSVNEELYTVNGEYQSKINELTELNNDIDNLLRNTDIGVVFLDRDLRIRKFTPAATIAINLVQADIDRPLEHITQNIDCPNLLELLRTVVDRQKSTEREVKLIKQQRYLLMRINPYLLEDGSLDGVVITFVDINQLKTIQSQIYLVNEELKQSQWQLRQLNQELEQRVIERTTALQQSEARLRAILETTSSIIYLKNLAGCYQLVNQQFLELFALEESEILGKSDRYIFPEQIAETLMANDHQVVETKLVHKFEEQLTLADGNIHTYISTKAPLINEQGEVYAICGISTDISEQKNTEAELREGRERERTILKVVEKIRQTLDLAEIFATVTQEIRTNLNCDRVVLYRFNPDWSGEFVAESVGKEWINLVNNEQLSFWEDTYLQETQGGRYSQNRTYVVDNIAQAGLSDCHHEIYAKIQAKAFCIAPIFQGDRLWGLLASYQNDLPRQWKEGEIRLLTQTANQLSISIDQVDLFTQIQNQSQQLKQAAEAAEAANQAKNTFMAHISHELRTPLNSIIGFGNILQKDPNLIEEQQNHAKIVYQSGQHLLTLINDILDFSKIEAGKLQLERQNFNLPSFLTNLMAIFYVRIEEKELNFSHQLSSALPVTVQTDKTRLRQILLNLISNAVKFTETGGITLSVFPLEDCAEGEKQKIRFQVEDTGIGIPADKLTDIFIPFQQLDSHLHNQTGTGLGLTITQTLLKLMGSEIQLSSTPGEGSRFWFDLELTEVDNPNSAINSNEQIITNRYLKQPCKVLVVDDNADNRSLLISYLKPLGFITEEAANGAIGLTKAASFQPDVILLDLMMPVMDGEEMTKKIRQKESLRDVVIFIISANSKPGFKLESLDFDAFIFKPVDLDILLQLLENYLQLEWIDNKNIVPQNDQFPLVAPPQNELRKLLDLTKIGDIQAIEQQTKLLEEIDAQYILFAQKVREITADFKIQKLEQMISELLETKS